MPRIKSAKKALRKSITANERNRQRRSQLRTGLKKMRRLIEKKDATAVKGAVKETVSAIDKAVRKGILHRNAAARRKSRIMKHLNAMEKGRS